jgi:1-acyl-sn-glycerol-3-phosphate acyltransferase
VAFLTFGVAAILVAVTMVPILRLVCRTQVERELRAQRIVQRSFVLFCWLLEALGLARIKTHDIARLAEPGTLVVANHPTMIDAVILVAFMPQADLIVKQANIENPILHGMAKACGYLPNLGGQSLVDACAERLENGRSLLLFPEGTRSPRNSLANFQRGAAHIALATGADLLPVLITCDPPTLMKGQAWYDVPDRPFEVRVRVGEPLSVEGYTGRDEPRGRTARALSSSLRERFEKGLASGTV